ncbi:MAG: zinc ribbon domain-containing protein [Planctomycetaceae bacterium]|nr:zinc ribbon domain-containing protein [Planctomycetaceae bacterium]
MFGSFIKLPVIERPMPTYEYRCNSCSHQFEEFQSIKASPLVKCPKCGKNKLARLIGGGAAIVFKGSGFYQTDYRSDSYKKGAKESKTTETTPATPPATPTPAAPAPPPTTKTDTKP